VPVDRLAARGRRVTPARARAAGRGQPRYKAGEHAARRQPAAAAEDLRFRLLEGALAPARCCALRHCSAGQAEGAQHTASHQPAPNTRTARARAAREVPVGARVARGHAGLPRTRGHHDHKGADVRRQGGRRARRTSAHARPASCARALDRRRGRSSRTCGAAASCSTSCWSARTPLSGQRTSTTTRSCKR